MTSKIVKCNCAHSMQDETNGVGNRNATKRKDGRYQCVICGRMYGDETVTDGKR